MWTLLLLLTVLLPRTVVCRTEDEQGSFLCGLSSEDVDSLLTFNRMWRVDDGALEKHDIQDIVNCTEEGDVISIVTAKTVKPRSRIVIPWQLTFTSSSNGTQSVVNSDLKATMTCPSRSGLFLLKSTGLVLRNVIVTGCDLSETDDVAGIIETEVCPSIKDGKHDQMEVRLQHVDFTRNRNLGGSLISVRKPRCYKVIMRDVFFLSNQYRRQSQLSASNDMRNVRLSKNGILKRTTSLFYFPSASTTIIDRITAEDNTGTLLFIKKAAIDIQNSLFTRNSALHKGFIFAIASEVSISATLFDSNRCDQTKTAVTSLNVNNRSFSSVSFINSNARGSTVSVSDPRNLEISNGVFEANAAGHGSKDSGVLRIDGGDSSSSTTSIKVLDCIFRNNSAFKSGGIVVNSIHNCEILISNSTFEKNTAGSYYSGGALSVFHSKDCTLQVIASSFKSNKGEDSGAISIDSSSGNMTFLNSEFKENQAEEFGGAILIIHSSGNMTFLDSEFKANKANIGGALYVGSPSGDITFLDSEFHANKANVGGALYLLSSSGNITFLDSKFHANNANWFGGAISIPDWSGNMTFLDSEFKANEAGKTGGAISIGSFSGQSGFQRSKFSQNQAVKLGGAIYVGSSSGDITFLDSEFNANKANRSGGAIHVSSSSGLMTFQTSDFKKNWANADGGAVYVEDSENMSVKNSAFQNNQAACGGGALFLAGQTYSSIKSCIFVDNKAIAGGGVGLRTSSADVISSTFLQNYAKSGGGLYSSTGRLSIKNCKIESNKAELYGGGIHTIAGQKGRIHLRSSSVLIKNLAKIGGGAFFQLDNGYENLRQRPVIIRSSVRFESNHAYRAGGSFFIDSVDGLDDILNCSRPLDDIAPFSSDEGLNTINVTCCVMKNNSVGEDGYGPNIATAATSFYLTVLDWEKKNYIVGDAVTGREKKDYVVGDAVNISRYKSGDQLPIFQVTTFDHFNQGPAITKSRTVLNISAGVILLNYDAFAKATIASQNSEQLDSLLSNLLVTDVSSGIGNITVGAPLQKPGTYPLVLWVGDEEAANIRIDVTLRSCSVNEASVRNATLCEECDSNHFSFDAESESCKPCPDNCDCTEWGIAPKDKHWVLYPCSARVMECLSDRACGYGGRDEALIEFYKNTAPTCDFETTFKGFNLKQCRKGHEGLLCGSCSYGYGQHDHGCLKCTSKWLVVLGLQGVVVYTFFACSVAIAGNLSVTESSQAALLDASRWRLSGSSVRSSREITIQREDVVAPLIECRREGVGVARVRAKTRDLAKSNVTESVKLFLNFAQVNSIATTINTRWTELLSKALSGLNVAGAMSVEKLVSLDCLFPKSAKVPRSIARAIISLLLPLLVLAIWTVYWSITIQKGPVVLQRRLVLSAVVVFYISYIGWVEHLSAALNCISIPHAITEEDQLISQLYWTEDTSVVCFEGSHLVLVLVLVVPMILTVLLMFPIGSAVYLYFKRRNGELNSLSVMEKFGFMYQAYTEECVFWDCLILLRKAVLALVIVFGASLGGNMQGLICISVLILSLFLQTKYMPYKEDFQSFNSIEIFSQLVCIFTFLSGLFLNDERISEGGRTVVSVLAIAFMVSFVVYFLFDLGRKIVSFCRISLAQDQQMLAEEDGGLKITSQWMRHRYARAMSKLNRAVN